MREDCGEGVEEVLRGGGGGGGGERETERWVLFNTRIPMRDHEDFNPRLFPLVNGSQEAIRVREDDARFEDSIVARCRSSEEAEGRKEDNAKSDEGNGGSWWIGAGLAVVVGIGVYFWVKRGKK